MFTGVAIIKMDGETFESEPGAKLSLGGTIYDTRIGHKVYGGAPKVVQSMLEITVFHQTNTPLETFRLAREAVIEFDCQNGVVYVVPRAWITESITITDGDGKTTMKFEGEEAVLQ